MGSILVTGGTGLLGGLLVPRLGAAGHEVRVLSRRPAANISGAATVTGDLRSGAGLPAAVDGVDAIVHCASDGRAAREVDVGGTRRLAEAARGSPHLVYVSIVGVDAIPLGYYRAKLAAEQVVASSGLGWTVQRATQFPQLIDSLLAVLTRPPVLVLPRGFRFQPVDPGELADRLVAHVQSGPAGRAPDLGGPQVLGLEVLAHTWMAARGRRRPLVQVPLPGSIARAFRSGANLCPELADGRRTWSEFLEQSRPRSR